MNGRRSVALLVQILSGTGFRIKRLAASRRGLFGKTLAEHWLARSKTGRQAVYDVDRSEDILDLRQTKGRTEWL